MDRGVQDAKLEEILGHALKRLAVLHRLEVLLANQEIIAFYHLDYKALGYFHSLLEREKTKLIRLVHENPALLDYMRAECCDIILTQNMAKNPEQLYSFLTFTKPFYKP